MIFEIRQPNITVVRLADAQWHSLLMNGEAKMELRRAGQTLPLKVREAAMWSLNAEVPAATEVGDYELGTLQSKEPP